MTTDLGRVPRIADLRMPPQVGKFYLVPVVEAKGYCGIYDALPVIGPAHTDKEHFSFHLVHYHVDARFLTARERRQMKDLYASQSMTADEHYTVGALPLSNSNTGGVPKGMPRLARRRCSANVSPYRHADQPAVKALRADLGEPDAIVTADGRKLCPHRKADLSQFAPDQDGFVVCPLHGLRVRCAHD